MYENLEQDALLKTIEKHVVLTTTAVIAITTTSTPPPRGYQIRLGGCRQRRCGTRSPRRDDATNKCQDKRNGVFIHGDLIILKLDVFYGQTPETTRTRNSTPHPPSVRSRPIVDVSDDTLNSGVEQPGTSHAPHCAT